MKKLEKTKIIAEIIIYILKIVDVLLNITKV